jgi:hypothetical protein
MDMKLLHNILDIKQRIINKYNKNMVMKIQFKMQKYLKVKTMLNNIKHIFYHLVKRLMYKGKKENFVNDILLKIHQEDEIYSDEKIRQKSYKYKNKNSDIFQIFIFLKII